MISYYNNVRNAWLYAFILLLLHPYLREHIVKKNQGLSTLSTISHVSGSSRQGWDESVQPSISLIIFHSKG
jgi:hypothetical protein